MALFVPNPEAESVEEIIEELSLALARIYRDAEDTLIREVAAREIRRSPDVHPAHEEIEP